LKEQGTKKRRRLNFKRRQNKVIKEYQTIIIGAGVGGLMAGRYLKDALILDKKEEIGKPVRSGEGISRQALERLGIEPDSNWISAYIDVIQRITPNGRIIGKFKEGRGYILDKTLFEKFLAAQCQAEILLNAEVIDLRQEKDLWKIKTKNGDAFESKILIGADGINSIVRRKIFQEPLKVVPSIQYLVELEKQTKTNIAKIYLDNQRFSDGYAWIFPKSKNTANIGLGGKGNLSGKFDEFMERVVKRDYESFKLLENRSGVIPFGGIQSAIAKENVLLVGDAAGLADPIFLGGINQAMWSAKIAAQCILENAVNLYESKIKSMPFADPELIKAREIFYSFDNQVLNELGEILENRGTSYLKTTAGIIKFLSKPNLRKNSFKLFNFFSVWWKNRDYLW